MFQLLAQYGRVDSQLLRNFGSQFVANNSIRDTLDVREKIVQRLDLAFSSTGRKLCASALNQVIKIALRMFEGVGISIFPFAANVEVGIESGFERENFDVEFFFDQEAQGALGGSGSGGVRIEIDDDIF